jgi:hypothetical protein
MNVSFDIDEINDSEGVISAATATTNKKGKNGEFHSISSSTSSNSDSDPHDLQSVLRFEFKEQGNGLQLSQGKWTWNNKESDLSEVKAYRYYYLSITSPKHFMMSMVTIPFASQDDHRTTTTTTSSGGGGSTSITLSGIKITPNQKTFVEKYGTMIMFGIFMISRVVTKKVSSKVRQPTANRSNTSKSNATTSTALQIKKSK